MKDIFIVSRFTVLEMIKKKTFKVILFFLIAAIIIGFNIPNIMNLIKNSNGSSSTDDYDTILVIDKDDLYKGYLESLNQMELGLNFNITKEIKTNKEIKTLIENKTIKAAINISNDNGIIKHEYITESIGLTGNILIDANIFTELYKVVKLSEHGLSEEDIIKINTPTSFDITTIGEAQSGNILALAMFLCIILFFVIYFFAYQVSTSITVEKTSKIIDTLITSTSPKSIVVGKTLGIGFIGLCEMLILVITALASYKLFLPKDILIGHIDLSGITFSFILIAFTYFILGYILYAFIYALTGSLVSKPEDAQQAGSLISIVTLIGFYLAYFSMMNPGSSLNNLATLLPISSPFSVPSRYIIGGISTNYLIISLIILIITIIFVAYASIKIYSSAILNYGTKFNFKTLVEMFKQDNK